MVDRCVCSNILFLEMKQIIDNKKLKSFDDLKQIVSFGKNCSLCVPYVELIITTGKIEFEPMQITGEKD